MITGYMIEDFSKIRPRLNLKLKRLKLKLRESLNRHILLKLEQVDQLLDQTINVQRCVESKNFFRKNLAKIEISKRLGFRSLNS